jgi:DNA polymerase I-like protein with 3'-5' exonuclease and polymerase domains
MSMNYVVLDLETSVNNIGDESIGKFKASPYHPDNKIVQAGIKHHECTSPTAFYMGNRAGRYAHGYSNRLNDMPVPDESTLLVGQNIAFDLAYLARDFERWDEWRDKGMIWDTMVVKYILSGQTDKFVGLNTLSEAVGGTIKDERIKDYWDAGVKTEDIPVDELAEYMLHDVSNTEMVFLDQLERADAQGMIPLIRCMMESRLATLEMEINGMHMDRDIIKHEKELVEEEIEKISSDLAAEILPNFPAEAQPALNINSTTVLSAYLFGDPVFKYSTQDNMLDDDGKPILFKSGAKKGQIRTKWTDHECNIVGQFNGTRYSKKGKSGKWATGEAVLSKIFREYSASPTIVHSVDLMLKLRGLRKDMSAYYVGYADLLWHDDLLHPSFSHCSTDTGRLSCSQPNVQQCAGDN